MVQSNPVVQSNPGVIAMTTEERQLLLGTSKEMQGLFRDRDDMLIGITTALLDVYRVLFAAGRDTKDAALSRLRAQHDQLRQVVPGELGCKALQWLIDSLETDKLDAAKLLREPTAGSV
jgi:hypothetical protein